MTDHNVQEKPRRGGIGRLVRESLFDRLSLLSAMRRVPLGAELIGRLRDHEIKIRVVDRRSTRHVHLPGSGLIRHKPDWVKAGEAMAVLADDVPTSMAHSFYQLKQKHQLLQSPNFNHRQLRVEDRLWFETVCAADATAFTMLAMMQLELHHNQSFSPFSAKPADGSFRCSEAMWLELKTRHATVTHLFGPHALPDMSNPDPLAVVLPRDGKPHWGGCLSSIRRRLLAGGPDATAAENPWLAEVAVTLAKSVRADWNGHWRPGDYYVREADMQRATRWGGRDTWDGREQKNPFEGLSDRSKPRPDSPKIMDQVRSAIEGLRNPRSFRP